MISFKVLDDKDALRKFLEESRDEFSADDVFCEIESLLKGYMEMEGDDGNAEIAVTVSHGCLLTRICAYDYVFLCPVPIGEGASIADAADEVRKYAIKEELPIGFIDVYADDVSEVSEPFRFTDTQPMDESEEAFVVSALTEIDMVEGVPTVEGEKIILDEITEDDAENYARLCRHNEVNKLYGNDYKDDYGDAPDLAFFGRMEAERYAGLSMSFAIRYEGSFAGEAVIFGFDFVGGAKVAIRLLPEFWGKGIGSEALELLLEVSKEIGLKTVTTAVKKENAPSIRMTGKYMNYKCDEDDTAVFEIKF
jgi:RimJ/RimL family protein N-acetyltransferase